MIKNELYGKIISEFVALTAKMYAYRKIGKKLEDKRGKGTKKCVVVKSFIFDDYNTCLFVGIKNREQMLFENKKHEMCTMNKHKNIFGLTRYIAPKIKFSIKDFFSKCDQIGSFLRIWSHLPKKSLMENFIFCAVEASFPNCYSYYYLKLCFQN